jgi:transcription initiation factor IIE alpha subunit
MLLKIFPWLTIASIIAVIASKTRIADITHSQFAIQLLDALFDRPIFTSRDLVARTGIGRATAMNLLRQLRDAEIVVEFRQGAGRRPGILAFPGLLNIAEGRPLF